MKKLILIICFFLSFNQSFAQTRVYISKATRTSIVYDIYNGASIVANNQKYTPSSDSLTNAQMRLELLAIADSVNNLGIATYKNVSLNMTSGWTLLVDSLKIVSDYLNIYYNILDDESDIVKTNIFSVSNSINYTRKQLKLILVSQAEKFKRKELFRLRISSFVGQFIQ